MKLVMICFAVFIFHLNICYSQSSQSEKRIVITQVKQLKDNLLTNVKRDPMSIAVLPFESTAGRSEARGLGEAAAILLNQTLIKELDITVIERNKLKDVLDEMSLSLSGMTSEEIKVGELLKADYLIAGAVADLNSRFLIAARLVEIKSGAVVSSSSIEIPAVQFILNDVNFLYYCCWSRCTASRWYDAFPGCQCYAYCVCLCGRYLGGAAVGRNSLAAGEPPRRRSVPAIQS